MSQAAIAKTYFAREDKNICLTPLRFQLPGLITVRSFSPSQRCTQLCSSYTATCAQRAKSGMNAYIKNCSITFFLSINLGSPPKIDASGHRCSMQVKPAIVNVTRMAGKKKTTFKMTYEFNPVR